MKGSTGVGLTSTVTNRSDIALASHWVWSNLVVQQAAADFNGDGLEDTAVLSKAPDSNAFNLLVFPGGSTGIQGPSFVRTFSTADGWDINAVKISAGKLNNDNFADLSLFKRTPTNGVQVYEMKGSTGVGLTSTVTNRSDIALASHWVWSNIY
jgi:hypothetical protein